MSIITISDFKGERTIAQASNAGVVENVNRFINKYEPKFLKSLLGNELYAEFVEGLSEDPIPAKWIALRDEMELKTMLVDYVYYWYMRNMTTTSAGTGEVKTKNENSTPIDNRDKMCASWNEMSSLARMFDLSTVDYPSFIRQYWRRYSYWSLNCGVSEIFYPINPNNI